MKNSLIKEIFLNGEKEFANNEDFDDELPKAIERFLLEMPYEMHEAFKKIAGGLKQSNVKESQDCFSEGFKIGLLLGIEVLSK